MSANTLRFGQVFPLGSPRQGKKRSLLKSLGHGAYDLDGNSADLIPSNPPFNPGDLNPLRWYDESSIISTDGKVSQWTDKSANGRDLVQATPTQRPLFTAAGLNGLDCVNWGSTSNANFLQESASITIKEAYYVIVGDMSVSNFPDYLGILSNSGMYWAICNAGGTGLYTPSSFADAAFGDNPTTSRKLNLFPDIQSPCILRIFNESGTWTGSDWRIGIDRFYGGRGWQGRMGELVVFSSLLSVDDRYDLLSYLKNKWSLPGPQEPPPNPNEGVVFTQSSLYPGPELADAENMGNYQYLDNATGTYSEAGAFIKMDLGSIKSIGAIVIGTVTNAMAGGWAKHYTEGKAIQYSTDDTNWTTVFTTPTYPDNGVYLTKVAIDARYIRMYNPNGYTALSEFFALESGATISAKYWRVAALTVPDASFCEFSQFQLLDASDNILTSGIVPTASTNPSGGSLEALSDGNNATRVYWSAGTAESNSFWIKYNFDTEVSPVKVRFASENTVSRAPDGGCIEYSKNNLDWVRLEQFSGITYSGGQELSNAVSINNL